MKLRRWRDWGIGSRLVTVAVVPATAMAVVICLALYASARDQIRADINEHGRLLAAALAESSRYAVVSGNTSPLYDTLTRLLAVDQGLIAIEVLDAGSKPIVSVGDATSHLSELQVFDAVIRAYVPDVDVFDPLGGPHVAAPLPAPAQFRPGTPAGYVRVIMSPVPVLQHKRGRLYLTLAVVLLAAIFSGVAGLSLAQRLRQPLHKIAGALRTIREGDYEVSLEGDEGGELRDLRLTILEMARALSKSRTELENEVAIRTRELSTAIDMANAAGEEKRRLIAQGNVLVEEERRRIAVEIHDHLNAALIFVQMEAQRIAALSEKLTKSEDATQIAEVATRISATTSELYTAARAIVKQLRPEVIDTLGLKGAVQEMVRNYDAASAGCRFVLDADPAFPNLPPQHAIAAYRVIQEALSNIVKHAHATLATVTMATDAASAVCHITIQDNGCGFDPEAPIVTGIGLIGMRERLGAVGGTIHIESAAGVGTTIAIELTAQKQ